MKDKSDSKVYPANKNKNYGHKKKKLVEINVAELRHTCEERELYATGYKSKLKDITSPLFKIEVNQKQMKAEMTNGLQKTEEGIKE